MNRRDLLKLLGGAGVSIIVPKFGSIVPGAKLTPVSVAPVAGRWVSVSVMEAWGGVIGARQENDFIPVPIRPSFREVRVWQHADEAVIPASRIREAAWGKSIVLDGQRYEYGAWRES